VPRPGRVEPVPWRPGEGRARLARADPMAVEAVERGIWLAGSPEGLQSKPCAAGAARKDR